MPALTPTEIRNLAGQKTAVFCRKMNTWLLMPEKIHSINKREADEEFEEHTLQYHGHHSSQYSHYERQTRRRFRNRGHGSHKRRSRTKESVAEKENGGFAVSELNSNPHHFNRQSFNPHYLNPEQFSGASDNSKLNSATKYGLPHSQFSPAEGNSEGRNENINKDTFNRPDINQDHSSYPNAYQLSSGPSLYPKRNYLNPDETGDVLFPDHVLTSDAAKNISGPFETNDYLARLRSDDIESETKSVTTISPEFLNQLRTDHPNVHSSLLHLLPLYKPLGREFDFPEKTEGENHLTNQHSVDKQRNVESEAHDSSTRFIPPVNKFTPFTDVNNTVHDPDVSVNVLENTRISKEFENVQTDNSPISQLNNNKQLHSPLNIRPVVSESHYVNSGSIIHGNKSHNISNTYLGHIPKKHRNERPFNRNQHQYSESKFLTTTEIPALTTHKYFIPEKTALDESYVPSVHTAFQNLEDFNNFQIFPNFIENNILPTSTETSSNTQALHAGKTDLNVPEIPQELILTTNHPIIEETAKTISNQRSDIPTNDKSTSSAVVGQKSFHFEDYNRTRGDIFPPKIRYQNALRDFKPDEIVIDIENIPTHTPTPVTASFHQRALTTIQPTVRVSTVRYEKDERIGRAEQTHITSWRSLDPTTRFPKRRVNDKFRGSAQSSSVPFVHRNSPNYNRNRFPAPQFNQLTGLRHFNPVHQTNRRQFFYPGHPVQPPNVGISPEINQLHHVNHMNNLPPGVSVHPRHPQAPFADMVNSNRPPTMPILNDSQEPLKSHHRQRHHRKKDRLLHSCCRLRGNSGALQTCCRNGGPCCSRSHGFVQPSNCCSSSSKVNRQIIPANQIQPNIRTVNKILPSIRTEKTHRSEIDNKDRCQKEKMCRTLYESTQQVMVCRNAHVEGC